MSSTMLLLLPCLLPLLLTQSPRLLPLIQLKQPFQLCLCERQVTRFESRRYAAAAADQDVWSSCRHLLIRRRSRR